MSTGSDFPLASPPVRTWVVLGAILLAVVCAIVLGGTQQAGPMRWWTTGLALVLTLAVLASIQRRRITLDGRMLVVRASLYTRKVPVDALRLDEARVLDLGEHTEFKPLLKTNGNSLPGFQAGNFRLRSRQRAFCLLVGDGRVLWLPRSDDSQSLLLSPERPQALLEALRAARA